MEVMNGGGGGGRRWKEVVKVEMTVEMTKGVNEVGRVQTSYPSRRLRAWGI